MYNSTEKKRKQDGLLLMYFHYQLQKKKDVFIFFIQFIGRLNGLFPKPIWHFICPRQSYNPLVEPCRRSRSHDMIKPKLRHSLQGQYFPLISSKFWFEKELVFILDGAFCHTDCYLWCPNCALSFMPMEHGELFSFKHCSLLECYSV